MGIKVNWDNKEQTIIRYDFEGNWNWHDFDQAVERSFTMTESVSHLVHVIMNFQKSKSTPDGAILYLKRKLAALPSNRGQIAIVGNCKTLETSLNMLARISNIQNRIIRVQNLNDARQQFASAPVDPLEAINRVFNTA